MGTEATKTRQLWNDAMLALFKGKGIDIGCGVDPVFPGVECFDQPQGDANRITDHVQGLYDFVFSSHCLEHMRDPRAALSEWYKLVRPGGHMVVLVPDEDLYEQGCFPSIFNGDHKFTFTLAKASSWSPRSINVYELARATGGEVVSLALQDHGYDRRLQRHAPGEWSQFLGRLFRKACRVIRASHGQNLLARVFSAAGAVIDQTLMDGTRLAQIQIVIRRPI